ncbi:hypothetical protein DE4381_03874 [Mycobacterium marinum]|nr:hypothetical protein DE4381_03874 [Mycobacterium marinum]
MAFQIITAMPTTMMRMPRMKTIPMPPISDPEP